MEENEQIKQELKDIIDKLDTLRYYISDPEEYRDLDIIFNNLLDVVDKINVKL